MVSEPMTHESLQPAASQPTRRGRMWKRLGFGFLRVLGLLLVFVCALVGGVWLHVNLPSSRRLISAEVNRATAGVLGGDIRIEHIGRITPSRITGLDVVVLDPQGREVMRVKGVEVRIDLRKLFESVRSQGPLTLRFPLLSIHELTAELVPGPLGNPTLIDALSPVPSTMPRDETPEETAPLRLVFESIELRHGHIDGTLAERRVVADVDTLDASFAMDEDGLRASLERFQANVAEGLGAPWALTATGHIDLPHEAPSGTPLRRAAFARIEARTGSAVMRSEATLEGHDFRTEIHVPETAPSSFMPWAPFLPTRDSVALDVFASGELAGTDRREPAGIKVDPHPLDPLAHFDVRARGHVGPATLEARATMLQGRGHTIDLAVLAERVDVSQWAEDAPASNLHVNAKGKVDLPHHGVPMKADATVHLTSSTLAGRPLPTTILEASLVGTRARSDLRAEFPSGNAFLSAEFDLSEALPDVRYTLGVPSLDLAELPALPIRGRASLTSRGHVALDKRSLFTTFSVRLHHATMPGWSFGKGELEGRVSGRLDALDLSAQASGSGLRGVGLVVPQWSLAASVASPTSEPHGRLALRVDGATFRERGPIRAALATELSDQRARATLEVEVAKAGFLQATVFDVKVPRDPTSGEAWQLAQGRADLSANVLLGPLLTELRAFGLEAPSLDLEGRLRLDAKMAKTRAPLPEVRWVALTDGLGVAQGETRIRGLDLRFDGTLDPTSRDLVSSLSFADAQGAVFDLSASAHLPDNVERLGREPDTLQTIPIRAQAELHSRRLRDLPVVGQLVPLAGSLAARGEWTGSMRAPEVHVDVHARGLSAQNPTRDTSRAARRTETRDTSQGATGDAAQGAARKGPRDEPLDLDARVDLAADNLDTELALRASSKTLVHARGHLEHPLDGTPLTRGHAARVQARFDGFDLSRLRPLVGNRIDGEVDGSVALEATGKLPRGTASLTVESFRFGQAELPRVALLAGLDGEKARTRVRLEQKDGFAEAGGEVTLRWSREGSVALDETQPVLATLEAKAFDASVAQPFVRDVVPLFAGRIDATVDAAIDVRSAARSKVNGNLLFSKGRLELPMLGQRFEDIRAQVRVTPGTLVLERLDAEALEGSLVASGEAHFDGLTLTKASLGLTVDEDEPLPVGYEGVPIGDLWGHVDVKMSRPRENELAIDVSLPELHLELPRATPRAVQDLGEEPTIRVGTYGPGGFEELPLERPSPKARAERPNASRESIRVHLHLGRVSVEREGTLEVGLVGEPTLVVGATTSIDGELSLRGGYLEVQGRRFSIEQGTVSFTGQPIDNPVVVATAVWEAPEGTRIIADHTGPVKGGKTTLRSEPSHTQDEILALLLFGSTSGSLGAQAPPGREAQTAAQAASVGGQYVAEALNRAFEGVSAVDIRARVDTSNPTGPRPEIEIEVTPDVTAQVVHILGLPAPGDNPDRTLLQVDWRFLKNWTLETTWGPRTSIADFVWRHRY